MTVYISMFLISLILARRLQSVKIKFYNSSVEWLKALILSLPFSIVAGFRADTVGIDYTAYTISYYNYGGLASGREREIIGDWIVRLANRLNEPKFIIWFYAVFICFGVMLWIVKQRKNEYVFPVALFFLTGCFNWSLNIMRQTAASVIVFLFMDLLYDEVHKMRSRILFCIIVVIAAMMHTTALLYLGLLIFPYEVFKKRIKWFTIALVFLPVISTTLRVAIMYFSKRFNFYYRYFNNYYDQNTYTGSLILVAVAVYVVVLLTYNSWSDNGQKKYIVLAASQYICLATTLLANIIPNNARATYMFFPITIVSLPMFYEIIDDKYKRIVELSVMVVLMIFYIHAYWLSNWGETIPYKWGI